MTLRDMFLSQDVNNLLVTNSVKRNDLATRSTEHVNQATTHVLFQRQNVVRERARRARIRILLIYIFGFIVSCIGLLRAAGNWAPSIESFETSEHLAGTLVWNHLN